MFLRSQSADPKCVRVVSCLQYRPRLAVMNWVSLAAVVARPPHRSRSPTSGYLERGCPLIGYLVFVSWGLACRACGRALLCEYNNISLVARDNGNEYKSQVASARVAAAASVSPRLPSRSAFLRPRPHSRSLANFSYDALWTLSTLSLTDTLLRLLFANLIDLNLRLFKE